MQFSESLKKNEQFRFVYKNGRSYANKYFIMAINIFFIYDSNLVIIKINFYNMMKFCKM